MQGGEAEAQVRAPRGESISSAQRQGNPEIWRSGHPLTAEEGGALCLRLLAWQSWALEGTRLGSPTPARALRPSVSVDISDAGPEDPPLGPSRKWAEYPSPPELLVGI